MTRLQDHWVLDSDTALCIHPLLYVYLVLSHCDNAVTECPALPVTYLIGSQFLLDHL